MTLDVDTSAFMKRYVAERDRVHDNAIEYLTQSRS